MRYIQIYPTLPLYINFGPHLNRPEYQSSKVEHTSKLQKSKLRWFRPCLNIGHIVCYGMFPTRLSLVDFAKKVMFMRCTRVEEEILVQTARILWKNGSIGTLQRFQKILNGIFWSGLHKYRPRKDFDDQMIFKTLVFLEKESNTARPVAFLFGDVHISARTLQLYFLDRDQVLNI